MLQGLFVNFTPAELATMATEWKRCLSNIATGHQSYTIGNRTFNRANIEEVKGMVAEITHAQKVQSGALKKVVYADMSSSR